MVGWLVCIAFCPQVDAAVWHRSQQQCSTVVGSYIVPVARHSACDITWHGCEQLVLAISRVVPFAVVVPASPAGSSRRYIESTTTVPTSNIAYSYLVLNTSTGTRCSIFYRTEVRTDKCGTSRSWRHHQCSAEEEEKGREEEEEETWEVRGPYSHC